MARSTFHVAMFPWLAMGHLTPFLHLSNKLAERGHRVSFLLPTKTRTKLEHFNHHRDLISFVPLVVPPVEGLPLGAETMSDVPIHMFPLLLTAMVRMHDQVEAALNTLKPNLIFFDFAHWVPALAHPLGIKSIFHCIVTASSTASFLVQAHNLLKGQQYTESTRLPPGYPPTSLQLHLHEVRSIMEIISRECTSGMSLYEIVITSISECDAISFRSFPEIDGPYCDYIEAQYAKPVLVPGPSLPELPTSSLEERWAKWLGGFEKGSVVYCALGSECILTKDQFQELVLGLEMTGLPFLAALKPPFEAATVEEALPEGFTQRVKGRGVVHGGWVQQTLILGHPSVGCFVTHCGSSSVWESLMNDCQLVLLPHSVDQFTTARILSGDLKVGVEIERREDDGWFTREDVCKAVKLVMDDDNMAAREIKANLTRLKDVLLKPGLEASYLDIFVRKLQDLICFK